MSVASKLSILELPVTVCPVGDDFPGAMDANAPGDRELDH